MYKGNQDNCHGQRNNNRKISLLTSKLNIELGKKFIRCYVWSIALYGSETWTLSKYLYWLSSSFPPHRLSASLANSWPDHSSLIFYSTVRRILGNLGHSCPSYHLLNNLLTFPPLFSSSTRLKLI